MEGRNSYGNTPAWKGDLDDFMKLHGIDRFAPDGYDKVLDHIGWREALRSLPFTDAQLSEAYARDKAFNTLPISQWDSAAGLIVTRTYQTETYRIGNSELIRQLALKGITGYAPSQLVCLLKACAARRAREVFSNGLQD